MNGESEDCLVLNVWTPAIKDGRKRPVMFWCHGGGFASGSGSSPGTDGTNLAHRGDVVVVTVNHRLNVLGFTYLGRAGGADFEQSGDVGMLDIVQALKWVRDNIEQFGGDPNTVTIFGQSGGGRKVGTLLAMPSAKGLFHRAIIESGPTIKLVDRSTANHVAERLISQSLQIGRNEVREDAEDAGREDHGGVFRRGQRHGRGGPDDRRLFAYWWTASDQSRSHPFDPVASPSIGWSAADARPHADRDDAGNLRPMHSRSTEEAMRSASRL